MYNNTSTEYKTINKMKKYYFNSIKHGCDIDSLVKWCKEMKRLHPWYNYIQLMIWSYEAGVVGGYNFQNGKKVRIRRYYENSSK